MELNSRVLNSIKLLSDATFTDQEYSALIEFTFKSFVVNSNTGQLELNFLKENFGSSEASHQNPITLKNTIAALYTVIGETVKNSYDINSLSTFLEDNAFSSERIKVFSNHYEVKKMTFFEKKMYHVIRLFLGSTSFSFPHVVDVKWRLDNHLKEDNFEKINDPVFLIDLKVEKPGQEALSTIQFSCTVEQLQELVYKLREATKNIEKLT